MSVPLAEGTIKVGEHNTATFAGLTFNLDTIWATAIAGLVVIVFGLWISRRITSGVPSGAQLTWETVIGSIEDQVESSIGRKVAPFVVPLAVTLFFFILFANWLELIPTEFSSGDSEFHLLPSPTADVNLTYAMALLVIGWMHTTGVRKKGWKKYFAHFFQPNPLLFPINLIEEIVKPFTLALRLFGNILSGGIMIAVIGLLPIYVLWAPNAIWKLFDMFIGVIQAFIFALLTILYFSFAVGGQEEGH